MSCSSPWSDRSRGRVTGGKRLRDKSVKTAGAAGLGERTTRTYPCLGRRRREHPEQVPPRPHPPRALAACLAAAAALCLGAAAAPPAGAAPGVQFGLTDDAWLLNGPGTLDARL